jgi:hypothetical protein
MGIISRIKVTPLLQSAYVGMTAGLLAVMLLDQWLWLEMRVNISILLPLAMLAGMLLAVFFKRTPTTAKALVAQSLCLLIFLYIYDFNFQALWVVPATWFREGFYLNGISIHELNWMLAAIFIVGNGSFLYPAKEKGKFIQASPTAPAVHSPVSRHP